MRRMFLLTFLGVALLSTPLHAQIIKLENQGTDRCLNVHGSRHDYEGAPISSYSCAETRDQEWDLDHVSEGLVQLENRRTGRCLNVHRGRHDYQGAPATSYTCADTPDQQWALIRLPNGNVKLRNESTGRFLNVHRGQHDYEGGPVTTYTCADTPDQEWDLEYLTGGLNCGIAEAVGTELADDLVARFEDEVVGETFRVSKRKKLRVDRISELTFDGCTAVIKAEVTLKRKIRRNAHGPVVLKAEVTSADLGGESVCLDDARVTSVKVSRTTRLGERFYRKVANGFLPDETCFGVSAPC